jgi:succinoglycan biosynthesis transport protein ExoP
MGSYFGLNGKNRHFTISGLGEFLEKRTEPLLYQPFISSSNNGLKIDLLPGGIFRENSTELLASPKMKNLIREKKKSYDFILIDTPPITRTVDTFVLGGFIKDIILVIRPNHTFRENVLWAIQEFEHEGINILGVVANACELSKSTYKHRYDYGYGEEYRYGYGKEHIHA